MKSNNTSNNRQNDDTQRIAGTPPIETGTALSKTSPNGKAVSDSAQTNLGATRSGTPSNNNYNGRNYIRRTPSGVSRKTKAPPASASRQAIVLPKSSSPSLTSNTSYLTTTPPLSSPLYSRRPTPRSSNLTPNKRIGGSSNSSSGSRVRHAGRVQVRGKIRRIWRPRYLELCNNGIVRYYEVKAASEETDEDIMMEDEDQEEEEEGQAAESGWDCEDCGGGGRGRGEGGGSIGDRNDVQCTSTSSKAATIAPTGSETYVEVAHESSNKRKDVNELHSGSMRGASKTGGGGVDMRPSGSGGASGLLHPGWDVLDDVPPTGCTASETVDSVVVIAGNKSDRKSVGKNGDVVHGSKVGGTEVVVSKPKSYPKDSRILTTGERKESLAKAEVSMESKMKKLVQSPTDGSLPKRNNRETVKEAMLDAKLSDGQSARKDSLQPNEERRKHNGHNTPVGCSKTQNSAGFPSVQSEESWDYCISDVSTFLSTSRTQNTGVQEPNKQLSNKMPMQNRSLEIARTSQLANMDGGRPLDMSHNRIQRGRSNPQSSAPGRSNTRNALQHQRRRGTYYRPKSAITPKSTLIIESARIIDVTTLRDMHVGLPRGRYGFVFHARLCTAADLRPLSQKYSPSSTTSAYSQSTSYSLHRQMHDPGQGCNPHNSSDANSRDYLCAVSTLEEAQSWVVALQWAASVANLGRFENEDDYTVHSSGSTIRGFMSGGEARTRQRYPQRVGELRSVCGNPTDEIGGGGIPQAVIARTTRKPKPAVVGTAASSVSRVRSGRANERRSGNEVIVVTKIRNYRISPNKRTKAAPSQINHPIEFYYEIRMLLLRGFGNSKSRKSDKNPEGADTQSGAEERIVYRSYGDFLKLFQKLVSEYDDDDASVATSETGVKSDASPRRKRNFSNKKNARSLDVVQKAKADLLSVKHMKHACSIDRHGRSERSVKEIISMIGNFPCETHKHVKTMDKVLRLLAMNGDICNSKSLRGFLSLLTDRNSKSPQDTSVDAPLSDLHEVSALLAGIFGFGSRLDLEKVIITRDLPAVPGETTDELVKRWLHIEDDKPRTKDSFMLTLILLIEKKLLSSALALMAVTMLCLCMKLCGGLFAQVITVRIDFYLFTLFVSFIAGHELGKKRAPSSDRRHIEGVSALRKRQIQAPKTIEDEVVHDTEVNEESAPEAASAVDALSTTTDEEAVDDEARDDMEIDHDEEVTSVKESRMLPSPLPMYPENNGESCWSKPEHNIFKVRGITYLQDRVKVPSAAAPFECRGVDVWMTDNPERHIARHPSVLGGKLAKEDTFVVNFLLPFCNFVAYFSIPPLEKFPPNLADVWSKFIQGDQQYRDARLKLLPVVVDGPWIVRKAVGPGTSPALLGKVIPLQYYFTGPEKDRKGVYEVDVIISASRIAKGILNVVKGHTKCLTIAFAFIIEAAQQEELPETVLCAFTMHELHLEECPQLPECDLDALG